ncbi:MAG: ATP-binding protein [Parcubacteria group bacterium]|jgi:hypothetical protein
MKKRLLYYEIIPYISHKNAIVITGMRQVGKTTLMRQIFEDIDQNKPKIWFDFDNPLDQRTFEDLEYRNIFERLKIASGAERDEQIYVFIDEIQNFPEITKIIKFLIDNFGVKFIVTGSSNFYLKNLFPESLSGRKFLYELSPLSFRECLYFRDKLSMEQAMKVRLEEGLAEKNITEFQKLDQEYEEYLRFGGFPEVVLTSDIETKRLVLKNIFTSFFEKDLKIISGFKDVRELRDFILLLVPRVGSMLDVSKLAAELGILRPKAYSYLEFLRGIFFIRLLPKFTKSIDRSVAGGKKIYFTDNGILTTVGNVNDAQLFENAVVNQLALYGDLSFYNKRNKEEIDIILKKEKAFEVKLGGSKKYLEKAERISAKIDIKQVFVVSRKYSKEAGMVFPMFL